MVKIFSSSHKGSQSLYYKQKHFSFRAISTLCYGILILVRLDFLKVLFGRGKWEWVYHSVSYFRTANLIHITP